MAGTVGSGGPLSAVDALSPLDGRYGAALADWRALFSEGALMRQRVRVEVEWLLHLLDHLPGAPTVTAAQRRRVAALADHFGDGEAREVKAIERRLNHDVKAVELFLRDRLAAIDGAAPLVPLVHFGCTSEDINNLSWMLMLAEGRRRVLLPALAELLGALRSLARESAALPMLSRTHGQAASPTTMGKELANFVARLERQRRHIQRQPLAGKMNGAVGNYNAHVVAYPELDWPAVSRAFVSERLQLEWNPYSTQIEPHDHLVEFCDAVARHNTVLLDCCRDLWTYVSRDYFVLSAEADEVGSSTMPHKVNPIDFENAEGNLGLANALLRHFADKLPVSRQQRDLSDSTVMRNVGVALGHALLAWRAARRGLARLAPAPEVMRAELDRHWEVLAEAVQSVLRASGCEDAYERLRDFSRGRTIGAEELREFVRALDLPEDARARLLALSPATYIGLAPQLARAAARQSR